MPPFHLCKKKLFLAENKDAKDFWRKQLMILIDKFADQALNSERDNETTEERVQKYKSDYKTQVKNLMDVERYDDLFFC